MNFMHSMIDIHGWFIPLDDERGRTPFGDGFRLRGAPLVRGAEGSGPGAVAPFAGAGHRARPGRRAEGRLPEVFAADAELRARLERGIVHRDLKPANVKVRLAASSSHNALPLLHSSIFWP